MNDKSINEPISAFVIQVYLRDQGYFMWLGPSYQLPSGFAARIEKYAIPSGGHFVYVCADAETIQEAAWNAAEKVCDMTKFFEWYPQWKTEHHVEQ